MTALIMGRPDMHENVYLAQAETELKTLKNHLRVVKFQNAEYRQILSGIIYEIFNCIDEFDRKRADIERDLITLSNQQKLVRREACNEIDTNELVRKEDFLSTMLGFVISQQRHIE